MLKLFNFLPLIIFFPILDSQPGGNIDTAVVSENIPQVQVNIDSVVSVTDSMVSGYLNVNPANPFQKHLDSPEGEMWIQPMLHYDRKAWLFVTLLLSIVIVAFVRMSAGKYMNELWRAAFNNGLAQQLYRDQEVSMPFPAFMLNLNFLITHSVFFFLVLEYFNISLSISSFQTFLIVLGGVTVIYSLRYIILKLISVVLSVVEELDFYNYYFYLLIKLSGIAIIPLLFFIAWPPDWIKGITLHIAIIFMLLTLVFSYLRGLNIGNFYLTRYKFHFFVYICTLELAPAIILVKTINMLLP